MVKDEMNITHPTTTSNLSGLSLGLDPPDVRSPEVNHESTVGVF